MTLRAGHGRGAGSPRIEVLPADELPIGMPDQRPPLAGVKRRQNGTVADPEAAKALGRRGGEVKARRVRLARSLGLPLDSTSEAFKPYRRAASAFREYHCRELARIAGGECGSGPSSMIASAALQLAASRFVFDQAAQTGDAALMKTASQLANDSRQNLLAAYELAQREAQARPKQSPAAALAARIAAAVRPVEASDDADGAQAGGELKAPQNGEEPAQ